MKLLKYLILALTTMVGMGTARAQLGNLATMTPNYAYSGGSFTAASQNGPTINLGGLAYATVQVKGTATAFGGVVQGSNDGGATWYALPYVSYASSTPTTVIAPSTTAITATGLYGVALAGLTNVRFATTSATYTGGSITVNIVASANTRVF
ncbi:MAG TPA: hypothetical protein VHB45_01225 [Alloacidobacterium sp.]|nr:hypothetical protein [Alloacidobacterium sp.]